MRNTSKNTPNAKRSNDEPTSAEKSSSKKLVQARLPFKIIAPSSTTPPGSTKTVLPNDIVNLSNDDEHVETRKRKLSYSSDEVGKNEKAKISSDKKSSVSKENTQNILSKKKKTADDASTTIDEVLLVDDSDNEDLAKDTSAEQKLNVSTNRNPRKSKSTKKGAGTPKQSKSGASGGSGGAGSATKLQIKIPVGGKNKRRKSLRNASKTETNEVEAKEKPAQNEHEDSSDDIEAVELNPLKRPKVEQPEADKINTETTIIDLDSELEIEKSIIEEPTIHVETEIASSTDEKFVDAKDSKISETDLEADDEADEVNNKSTNGIEDILDSHNESITSVKSSSLPQDKTLTKKQIKLLEQRRKAREEKERKLAEERKQKQQEKEEKEEQRRKEREDKEEQKRKEREEREEVKRKEREEKERKRLAELEAKNEEKRKRNEAKEEELRKKEDDRKRKEQEKEEAELKKKKAAQAFSKFFVPKSTRSSINITEQDQNSSDNTINNGSAVGSATELNSLAFRPFQIKGDMKLAPLCRKTFTTIARSNLDKLICGANDNLVDNKEKNSTPITQLYLAELSTGKIIPGKWRRQSTDYKDEDEEVQIVEDDLERVSQAITEEPQNPAERLRAKFFKFCDNRRPPYYGTWRKKTRVITARRPLAQDTKFFDYEVDSDFEWEEEEPGESLDGSDDDKDKESEDDDYEVDNEWFVPHGHLSDEELQNEDELSLDDGNTREAQKAKLQILQREFAQEMKKETKKIKPRLIGCIWVDENGNQPELCPNIIWDTLNKRSILFMEPPLVEEQEQTDKLEPTTPDEKVIEKIKPLVLSEALLKDLIRLVHGNNHAKVFLVNEFIAYIEANEDAIKNGEARIPLKSAVREKIDEYAIWKAIEVNNNNNNKKSKKPKKRLCWVVADDVLEKMHLSELNIQNAWTYILPPKFISTLDKDANTKTTVDTVESGDEEQTNIANANSSNGNGGGGGGAGGGSNVKRNVGDIKKFTKILTAEEKQAQQRVKLQSSVVSGGGGGGSGGGDDDDNRSPKVVAQSFKKNIRKAIVDNAAEQATETLPSDDDVVVLD